MNVDRVTVWEGKAGTDLVKVVMTQGNALVRGHDLVVLAQKQDYLGNLYWVQLPKINPSESYVSAQWLSAVEIAMWALHSAKVEAK